jgi:hypothetical protein
VTGIEHEDMGVSMESTFLLSALLGRLSLSDFGVRRVLLSLEPLLPLSREHCEATAEVVHKIGVHGVPDYLFDTALDLLERAILGGCSDEAIVLAAEFAADAFANGLLWEPGSNSLVRELARILKQFWAVCDPKLTCSLLGVAAAALDAGYPDFARVLKWDEYESIVRVNTCETATRALDIITTLMMANAEGCRVWFELRRAVEIYAGKFLQGAPFEALPVWVEFCFATACGRAREVSTELLRGGFVSLLPRCAETDDIQLIGRWLVVVVMMVGAALDREDKEMLREALSKETVSAKIEEIVSWEAVFRWWEGEEKEAVLGAMATTILDFIREPHL